MSGSFDILKYQIKLLKKEIETYKKNFETQIERADEWMLLYMEVEKENQELKKLVKNKNKGNK
tara:strand:+ start:236 stop:424 length:189 start_codon:yes stop_codon:yes gene_type:complete